MTKVVDKVVDDDVIVDNLKRTGIGARFKAARKRLGFTQKALAEALGVSWRGIQENENHDRVPGGKTLSGLAALGLNTQWLLAEEGDMLLPAASAGGAQGAAVYKGGGITKQLQDNQVQNLASEPDTQPGQPAAIDAAFLRLCLGACVMVHGEAFAAESAALQLEYACDLYNQLMKQAAANGQGPKAAVAAFSRLETRGLADHLGRLLQLGWVRQYTKPTPPPPKAETPPPAPEAETQPPASEAERPPPAPGTEGYAW